MLIKLTPIIKEIRNNFGFLRDKTYLIGLTPLS